MADDDAFDCAELKDEQKKNENIDNIKRELPSPFEMEQTKNNKITMTHKRKMTSMPSWLVILRYLAAASAAVSLAFFCPATVLRKGDELLDFGYVSGLIVSFISTLAAFICVHNSNPGYLTSDIVKNSCKEDGLTLLGYEKENKNISTFDALDPDDIIGETNNSTEVIKRTNAFTSPEKDDVPFSLALDHPAPQFRGNRRNVCQTCEFAPPLRSHHCRFCDRCVATFDHHCHFIGTCIGERNHCRFWNFLLIQTISFWYCGYIVVGSTNISIWGQVNSNQLIIVLVAKLYLNILTFVSTLMLIMHTIFGVTNHTTFECAKDRDKVDYLRGTRPTDCLFSRGICKNLYIFCCKRDDGYCFRQQVWQPILWQTPGKIIRDSEDWWEHPFENKYWSCC